MTVWTREEVEAGMHDLVHSLMVQNFPPGHMVHSLSEKSDNVNISQVSIKLKCYCATNRWRHHIHLFSLFPSIFMKEKNIFYRKTWSEYSGYFSKYLSKEMHHIFVFETKDLTLARVKIAFSSSLSTGTVLRAASWRCMSSYCKNTKISIIYTKSVFMVFFFLIFFPEWVVKLN